MLQKGSLSDRSCQVSELLSYCGGLLLTVGMVFSGVKWNPINGKMAGMGCFVASAVAVYVGSGTFFLYHAAVLLLGGAHIFIFPSKLVKLIPAPTIHSSIPTEPQRMVKP